MLEDLRHNKRTVGLKQTLKALEQDKALTVFLADDAEDRVIGRVKSLCHEKEIDIEHIESMKKLGKACGIDVGAAVAGLVKE